MHDPLSEEIERVGKSVLDAAFHVHTVLGPGLLESVYEKCLCDTLHKRGVELRSQALLPITFEGDLIEAGLRLDLLVEDCVIVELKAVAEMNPIFQTQLISYLKLSKKRLGFLINFDVPKLRDGIKRIVV